MRYHQSDVLDGQKLLVPNWSLPAIPSLRCYLEVHFVIAAPLTRLPANRDFISYKSWQIATFYSGIFSIITLM